jgi:hypothetical protein
VSAALLLSILLFAGSSRRAEAQAPPAKPAADAAPVQAPEEKPAELRMYDVGDLVQAAPDRPLGSGVLPPTQLNGILGSRAYSNNYPFNNTPNRSPETAEQSLENLVKLIEEQIAPDSWRETGGVTGSISVHERLLVVRQTPDAQRQVTELLDLLRKSRQGGKVVTIHSDWLWLTPGDLDQIVRPRRPGASGREIDAAALQKLGPKALYAHGELTCAGGQTVHLLSGRVKTLVENLEASVGTGSSAFQPEVDEVLQGVAIQVTPRIQGESASVDILGFVSGWESPMEPYRMMTQNSGGTPATHPAEPDIASNGNSVATMDRMNVLAQEFCTTASLPLGKSVLIGGMTLEPEGSAAADAKADPKTNGRQLYLTLRVDAD